MATKKTVVEMFEEIKGLCVTDEQKAFIDKRIEITKKKNAGTGEPTAKQKAKMAADTEIENAIVASMSAGVEYTAGDLVKVINRDDVPNTQKLTPRLTALVTDGKLTKGVSKGKSVYSLVAD